MSFPFNERGELREILGKLLVSQAKPQELLGMVLIGDVANKISGGALLELFSQCLGHGHQRAVVALDGRFPPLARGKAVFLPASAASFTLSGDAVVYRASTNL